MKSKRRMTGLSATLVLFATLSATAPSVVAAQDAPPLDRERITQFARAHMAMNDARDDFHGKIGRVHDEEGRRRAREELEATIVEILEAQEMTQEQYDELTLAISLDAEIRATFEEVMVELAEEGTGP